MRIEIYELHREKDGFAIDKTRLVAIVDVKDGAGSLQIRDPQRHQVLHDLFENPASAFVAGGKTPDGAYWDGMVTHPAWSKQAIDLILNDKLRGLNLGAQVIDDVAAGRNKMKSTNRILVIGAIFVLIACLCCLVGSVATIASVQLGVPDKLGLGRASTATNVPGNRIIPTPFPAKISATPMPAPSLATSLRGVLYHDDFGSQEMTRANGWFLGSDDKHEAIWSPHQYSMIVKKGNLRQEQGIRGTYKDFGIEIEAQPEYKALFYGIEFRVNPTSDNFYLFACLPDGGLMLQRRLDGKFLQPGYLGSQVFPAVKAGAVKNRLGVLAEGSTISVYVNGQLIKTITDTSLASGGIRLVVGTIEDTPLPARVDFFRVSIYSVERAKAVLSKTDNSTAAALDGVLFFDDFSFEQNSIDKGLILTADERANRTWSPNQHTVTIKKPNATGWSSANIPTLENFGVEIEAQPDNLPGMHYGLVLRENGHEENANFYLFGVTTDGDYYLTRVPPGQNAPSVLLTKIHTPLIKRGGEKNRLGVLAQGDALSLFINGTLVQTVTDDAIPRGLIFLYAGAGSQVPARVAFSSMTVFSPERAKAEWGTHVAAGGILFQDTFGSEQVTRDNGWKLGVTEDKQGELAWSSSHVSLSVKQKGLLVRTPTTLAGDMAVEIEAQPGNDPGTEYGIVFRYNQDENSRYLFGATLDGKYFVRKQIGGNRGDQDPVPTTSSSYLKPGAKNRLGVIADGSTISLYINGLLVHTFTDNSLQRGLVGVFVQAINQRARVDVSRMTILTIDQARDKWGTPGILFHDDFTVEKSSKEKGWVLGPAQDADYAWSPNQLTMKVKRNDAFARNYPNGTFSDFGVEIEGQSIGEYLTEYGILFRQSGGKDANSLYYFGISTQGTYYLYKKVNGAVAKPAPIEDTSSPFIHTGASKNRLGVLTNGATISLYINGNLVKTINDSSLASGEVGVFVATGKGDGWSTVSFNRMTIYTPEKAATELPKR